MLHNLFLYGLKHMSYGDSWSYMLKMAEPHTENSLGFWISQKATYQMPESHCYM